MSWTEEARERTTVDEVAMALGLPIWTKAGARGFPCPEHPAPHKDGRATGRIVRNGTAFWCHKCGRGGDVVALVCLQLYGERTVRGERFHAVRAWFAERGWCPAYEGGRDKGGPYWAPRKAVERPEEPPPARAPSGELEAFWGACEPLRVDGPVWRWMAARDLPWKGVNLLDLARCIPPTIDSPAWAGFQWTDRRTGEEVRRPWAKAGWNLALPCFDSAGALVAIRARWTGTKEPDWPPVDPERSETYLGFGDLWEELPVPFSGKEVSPRGAGFCKGTVYADPVARWLLEGAVGPVDENAPGLSWSGRVWIFEGGPAWLRFSTARGRVKPDGQTDAIFGVWSGAWGNDRHGRELARRCKGAQAVMVATDDDKGGDRIGRPIVRTLQEVGVKAKTLDWKKVNHG